MTGPRYVCIHGHFYQPPRENPWIEAIEAQKSAWPAHDWNERVADECYAPNAHARVLDEKSRIRDITSNYARMSFNFGPTLLSWMEQHRPELHAAVIEADRESATRFDGYGAAIAQVYNHMILPLANRRDQLTQVRWGIADFRRRFGRAPDGMWLAETAVDTDSLEALAECGIGFTILAPHQCREVRAPGGAWAVTEGQRVDPRRPYLARLPSGRSIVLFFYDGPTSRAVAFERVLDDGHRFADRILGLLDLREEPQLVHLATDGETYGHHHVYGEMALAVALARVEKDPRVTLTNYAAFLARHPPTWEARIREETSWSCAHGIERWRSDCGCNSGTTRHQRWRAPLREALDALRDALAPRFEALGATLFKDPWAARDAYVDVVLDRSPAVEDAFFAAHGAETLSAAERTRALELLELQRHAMLMYTSCGWFFDDISGIETVQVIQYAARAMDLATSLFGDHFRAPFVAGLARAPSNAPEHPEGGASVYRRFVEPASVDLPKVAAHLAVASVLREEAADPLRLGGGFRGQVIEHELMRTGGSRLAVGRLRVRSIITGAAGDFGYAVLHIGDHNVIGGVSPYGSAAAHVGMHASLTQAFLRADLAEVVRHVEQYFPGKVFSLRQLLHDPQAAILERLLAARRIEAEEQYESVYDATAPLLRFLESLGQECPPVFRAAAEYTLMARLRRELAAGRSLDLSRVGALLDEARLASVVLDAPALGRALRASLVALVAELSASPEDLPALDHLERVARFAEGSPYPMEIGEVQNALFRLARDRMPGWRVTDPPRAARLERIAAHLMIDVRGVG